MTAARTPTARLSVESMEDRLVPASVATLDNAGTLLIKGDNGSNVVRVSQTSSGTFLEGFQHGYRAGAVKRVVVETYAGNDVIDLRNVAVPCTVRGGDHFDQIFGGQGNDVLDGGNHDDRIWAGGGADAVYGGHGNDRLFGNDGYDTLVGGAGADFMDDGSRTAHEAYTHDADADVDYVADMFAPNGVSYSADHVRQGSQNLTCHFLATIAGMAQAGTRMGNYIEYVGYTTEGVGIYNVSFWNGRQWFKTQVLFAGHDDARYARPTADYASWAIIMSTAWNQAAGNRGGTPGDAMRALGRTPSETTTITDANFAAIGTAISRGYAVASGTGHGRTTAALETRHAYQVAGTRVVNGQAQVLLRNPWGFDSAADPRSDGYLWVTWATFKANMVYLAIG